MSHAARARTRQSLGSAPPREHVRGEKSGVALPRTPRSWIALFRHCDMRREQLESGRVQQSNFHDYPMLRIYDAPVIDIELVQSSAPHGGIGEPGTSVLLAACVNVIHAATGKGLYTLPAKADDLRQG